MAVLLIVEDEEQVRMLAESILQEHPTLSASIPELACTKQAIALLESKDKAELLFTDLGCMRTCKLD